MESIVVNCSSIYNIDFTSAIFYCLDNPSKALKIFINEKSELGNNPKNRRYISRLSLPLFKWEKDKTGTWRLLHYPIEEIENEKHFLEIIKQTYKTIEEFKLAGGGKPSKFPKILETISRDILSTKNTEKYEPIILYCNLIKSLLKVILPNTPIQISLYGNLYSGEDGQDIYLETLLQLIKELRYRNNIGLPIYEFNNGGKISIYNKGNWVDFNRIKIQGDNITLYSSDSDIEYLISFSEIENRTFNSQLRFRGPLEHFLFSRFGKPADHPYYLRANFSLLEDAHREYISPISVTDINRVSKLSGGKGFRLNPSGYSLLDFENSEIMYLLRGVFGDKDISWSNIYDWQFIINNYPRSNEKIAESQSSVKELIHNKEWAYRLKLRDNQDIVLAGLERINCSQIGDELIKVISFIRYLRDLIYPNNQIDLGLDLRIKLEQYNLIQYGKLNVEKIGQIVKDVLIKSLNFLTKIGFNCNESILNNFSSIFEVIQKNGNFNVIDTSFTNFEKYRGITHLCIPLQNIAFEYYSYMIFFLSSVIKNNILFSSYILGIENCSIEIEKLLKKRGGSRYLRYKNLYINEL